MAMFQRASALRVLAIASLALTSCSVARQRVNLTIGGDVSTVDSPRRGPGAEAPQASPAALSRQMTAGIRCPVSIDTEVIGGVVPGFKPATCMSMANRDDREVVGGPLGVVASAARRAVRRLLRGAGLGGRDRRPAGQAKRHWPA